MIRSFGVRLATSEEYRTRNSTCSKDVSSGAEKPSAPLNGHIDAERRTTTFAHVSTGSPESESVDDLRWIVIFLSSFPAAIVIQASAKACRCTSRPHSIESAPTNSTKAAVQDRSDLQSCSGPYALPTKLPT